MPNAVLVVYLEKLLIMKKDELRVNSPMSCLHTTLLQRTKSIDSEIQCMCRLGGAVQAIEPESPSPEIGHETARNLQRTMQARVGAVNNAAVQWVKSLSSSSCRSAGRCCWVRRFLSLQSVSQ